MCTASCWFHAGPARCGADVLRAPASGGQGCWGPVMHVLSTRKMRPSLLKALKGVAPLKHLRKPRISLSNSGPSVVVATQVGSPESEDL